MALLERILYGTAEPDAITEIVDAFSRRRLGAGVARFEFHAIGVATTGPRGPARRRCGRAGTGTCSRFTPLGCSGRAALAACMTRAGPGHKSPVNRLRYQGYVAVKGAIADELLDLHAGGVIRDLAESLLLARDKTEAEKARERVPAVLLRLVDEGSLSRAAAHRFFVRVRACGPEMHWPPSWQRRKAPVLPRWALREQ